MAHEEIKFVQVEKVDHLIRTQETEHTIINQQLTMTETVIEEDFEQIHAEISIIIIIITISVIIITVTIIILITKIIIITTILNIIILIIEQIASTNILVTLTNNGLNETILTFIFYPRATSQYPNKDWLGTSKCRKNNLWFSNKCNNLRS